ncbi:MAG: glycoside hydrolase family 31 protein [Prevotella sp.]|nr:glycoside hydrolase family 31 protein [Prevotella sp.]
MKRLTLLLVAVALTWSGAAATSHFEKQGQTVTVRPDSGQARVVRLQMVNADIIRVRATSDSLLPWKPKSLMIVDKALQTATPFTVCEQGDDVVVATASLKAVVSQATGVVTFYDSRGRLLLHEAEEGGKQFRQFTVPPREYGCEAIADSLKHGIQWHMVFDSPADEAFYGLGQHQSEELNLKGRNEDLFQYNTKASIPFVVSNKGYGLLWDSYSYCRFGKPDDYAQLNNVFRLYDRYGNEGHLTGIYTDRDGHQIVRQEDSIYYEYDCPATSQLATQTESGGIKNLPQGFRMNGASVVYEGFIEPRTAFPQEHLHDYSFILYYAGYVTVYIDGREIVAQRWRTAWNPNAYKFTAKLPTDRKAQLRIEWLPDGDVSYCGLRVAPPVTNEEQQRLSIWCEMARDMDYYFIAGQTMDSVIAGYRTLTGRAPVFPKWTLGYWQSRERYKTQDELLQTLSEFRRRHLTIDNIVQDWNYWPIDAWGSHRFEASRYPDPQQMVDSVHTMHGRFMLSVWPKFYDTVDNYRELDANGWIYRQAIRDDIHDWLGFRGSFYDAYSEEARKVFWRQMDDNLYTGLPGKTIIRQQSNSQYIDAWWMDASEPNVRDCTPMWYRKALCGPTALGTSTEYFNAYALVNAQAIYEGQRSSSPTLAPHKRKGNIPRVFLLTRSGFAGLQRYATATWSGDIATRWEDMRAQMTAGMNFSLSGIPFWGMDQGGFCVEKRYEQAQRLFDRTGQESDDLREWRELQTRWAQMGAFIPLYRAHGQWPLREPWHIAPEGHPAYQSFQYYDRLRYRLMPYLYSMAGWVNLSHYTPMRALVMDYGSDPAVLDLKDQWMFGPALMACPVSRDKARSRPVYFPLQCGWYDFYTGKKVIEGENESGSQNVNRQLFNRRLVVDAPLERIPVFVPEGAILPIGPDMEWSDQKPADPVTLYVYAGRDGTFLLYEDDGTSYSYEQGARSTIPVSYNDATRTITIGARQGSFLGMLKQRRFYVVLVTKESPAAPSPDGQPQGHVVVYKGKAVSVKL